MEFLSIMQIVFIAVTILKYLVPQVVLEPTRLSALASKTSVASVTPPGQKT